jgi:hypothetical protein
MTMALRPERAGDTTRNTILDGGRLALARATVAALGALTALVFVRALPATYAFFATPCPAPACQWGQIAAGGAPGALAGYAAYMVGLIVFFALAHGAVAGVILLRASRDWMALLVALFLIVFGATFPAVVSDPAFDALGALASGLLILFLALFPDGRFAPRWTRLAAILWIPAQLLVVGGGLPFVPALAAQAVKTAAFLLVLAALLGAQIYRYRRVSGPAARRQTRWVVYGVTVALAGFALMLGVFLIVPPAQMARSTLLSAGIAALFYLWWMFIPVSLGFAILRARLYDIEVVIHRTLVYAALTVCLAGVYVGGVALSQAILQPLTGQGHNELAIVGSTLAAAAAFQPLRRRIQRAIDRRFYRRKYDAARTLADFTTALREEVDLHELVGRLVGVVDETMQPQQVSLWLRAPTSEQ